MTSGFSILIVNYSKTFLLSFSSFNVGYNLGRNSMFNADYFLPVMDLATPVRLAARSFIIPIPKGAGEPMVYPYDIDGAPNQKKGMPLLDKHGQPKGVGIVFINHTDGALQAVRGDGNGMIIINGVSAQDGETLLKAYKYMIPEPELATAGQIQVFLNYAHDELGIEDFFNSERAKIPGFEVVLRHPSNPDCGVFLRRSDEERFAVIGYGKGTYQGPAATPQRFNGHVVAVGNAKHVWLVQTSAFLNTYRHPDDSEIKISELPAFNMQEGSVPAAFVPG
jgi:hypothetical protein